MKTTGGLVHVEEGPIAKTLLSFALPVLAAQLLQEIYNATDCAVVGHFAESHALAAAGVAGLLLSVLINFFVGFSSGVSVITGRLFGARDFPELRRTMTAVFRLVLWVGLAMTGAGYALAAPMLRVLRCPAEVAPLALLYLRICLAGIVPQLAGNVGTAILRSLGDTRTPLWYFLLSVVWNLVLDVVLVAGLHTGVAGAAAATLTAQWLLGVLILRRMTRLGEGCELHMRAEGGTSAQGREILRRGFPAGMQALFMSISSLLIQSSIDSFGPAAMAGMTVFAKVEGLLYLPSFAYGIALTGFVGQNYGARKPERIRQAVRISALTMCAVILPLSLILTAACPWLLRLFTRDEAILWNAREAVRFTLPVYVVYAVNQIYLGAVKGMGDTAWPMVCTLVCYSLFRVAWCRVLIPVYPTMRIVYLSYAVSFFLMLALILPAYIHRLRQAEKLT